MKFPNLFGKREESTIDSFDIDAIFKAAENFVGDVISKASPERSRLIELAAKNGTLTVSVDIVPKPRVRILIDPGEPVCIDF